MCLALTLETYLRKMSVSKAVHCKRQLVSSSIFLHPKLSSPHPSSSKWGSKQLVSAADPLTLSK